MKTTAKIFLTLLIAIVVFSCKKQKPILQTCPGFDFIPTSPYEDPIWHPSGKIIGFNHTPIKEINYNYGYDCPRQANYLYKTDSAGFWIVNADGTNKKRILVQPLYTPAWSPDGKWIAYNNGGQLFIMPFDGEKFDVNGRIQLTNTGSNFFPAWSPDGKWIAYTRSICNAIPCGVWVVNVETKNPIFLISFGGFPIWKSNAIDIIYQTTIVQNNGNVLGDSLWIFNRNTNLKKPLFALSGDNRYFKYSNNKITFTSQSGIGSNNLPQIWVMDADGSNKKQLTQTGAYTSDWSPDGTKIVYLRFDYTRIDENQGALWTMNTDGSNKKQLTYNTLK